MPQEEKKHISTTTGLLIILAAAVIIGGGAIACFYVMSPTSWDYMGNRISVHKNSNKNANANTNNNANTNTAALSAWKNYTNSKYGFTMTFPDVWKGYRVFESQLADGTISLYVAVPTTDATWKEENIDSGYATIFAIGVLTPAQWTDVQAQGGPVEETYLTKNSNYVFTSSSAQAVPTDLISEYNKTLKPADVIDTFKIQ